MRLGVVGIAIALLFGLLLAPGAANAAFVVPPVPDPPVPTAPAPNSTPGSAETPAPPSGRAPNDTLPAPSSPEAPSSGPGVTQRAPAAALQPVPFSTLPAVANAVTCYIVVDKVTPTKPVSNIIGRGCHNGPRIPPLLNGLLPGGQGATSPPATEPAPSTAPAPTTDPAPGLSPEPSTTPAPAPRFRADGPSNSAAAPEAAPQAAAASSVPLIELYGGTNYGGSSFIIYGSGGGCDAQGYRLPDIASQNSSVGGASSYRAYNNCSNQALHNETDFGGTANYYTGYNRSSLPSGYDNNIRSARLTSVPCTYYNETNASVCGLIRDKYNALGGPDGPLGFPTSNELTNPDGVGKRNTFQGATSIYWTPATGAHDVRGALRDAWARNGWETGALGYPVSDQLSVNDSVGRVNRYFKNNTYAAGTTTRTTGSIYWSPSTNAWAVRGAISDKYSALGGATGALGYPTSDEVAASDGVGRRNSFEKNGGIWWSQQYGASSVQGEMMDWWRLHNYESGILGYPLGDAAMNSDNVGKRQQFAKDRYLYWTAKTGAHDVGRGTMNLWSNDGYEQGAFGYPVEDEQPGDNNAAIAKFSGGMYILRAIQLTSAGEPVSNLRGPANAPVQQPAAPTYVGDLKVDNPHFSEPGRGNTVVFKTFVYLTGPTPLMIRNVGILRSAPGAPPPAGAPATGYTQRGAPSDQVMEVANLGQRTPGSNPYYTPMEGAPLVLGSAWYEGGSLIEAVNPPPGNYEIQKGVKFTNKVYVPTP